MKKEMMAGGEKSEEEGLRKREAAVRMVEQERASEPLLQEEPPTKDKKRTTASDPNFLSTFFKASRLHFIGEWRDRWEALLDELVTEEAEREARDKAKAAAKKTGRVVFHVDLDCFFASVATRSRPGLAGTPVAVCWSSAAKNSESEISSANYEARRSGVRAGMFLGKAKELCPELTTVPFEFDEYAEAASCAYACVIGCTKVVMGKSIDECYADVSDVVAQKLHDSTLQEAAVLAVADELRNAILEATGCTASVGAGPNMLLARVATSLAKPDGRVWLDSETGARKLAELPCSALPSVGFKRFRALNLLNIETCRDLLAYQGKNRQLLVEAFGGEKLASNALSFAAGLDDRQLDARPVRKSVSAQCSYGFRCTDQDQARTCLIGLAQQVLVRCSVVGVLQFGEEEPVVLNDDDQGERAGFVTAGADAKKKSTTTTCKGKRPARQVKNVTLKLWRAKGDPNDWASCKAGVGHGRCDVLSKTVDFNLCLRDRPASQRPAVLADCAFDLFAQLNCPYAAVRGMGLALGLHASIGASTGTGRPTIVDVLRKRPAQTASSRGLQQQQPPQQQPTTNTLQGSPPRRRSVVILPVGLPGAGKSTFFREHLSELPDTKRVCQDVERSRKKVEDKVDALARAPGNVVFVDRTNYDADQRANFVRVAKRHNAFVVALVFDVDRATCFERCANRVGHEGGLDSRDTRKCAQVVAKIDQMKRPVDAANEGFDHVLTVPVQADSKTLAALARQLVRFRDLDRFRDQSSLRVNAKRPRSWVHDAPQPPPDDHDHDHGTWPCAQCTFINPPIYLSCDICHATRPTNC